MALDSSATTVGYFDGRWYESVSGTGADTQQLVTGDSPALDSASFDATTGAAVFVLDKTKWGLTTGDVLKNVHATTRPAAGQGQVFQIEEAGYDVSYPLVGNDFCVKGGVLAAPVINVTTPTTTPGAGSSSGAPGTVPLSPGIQRGRFGGGALPVSLLMVLLLGAGLRRRRS